MNRAAVRKTGRKRGRRRRAGVPPRFRLTDVERAAIALRVAIVKERPDRQAVPSAFQGKKGGRS